MFTFRHFTLRFVLLSYVLYIYMFTFCHFTLRFVHIPDVLVFTFRKTYRAFFVRNAYENRITISHVFLRFVKLLYSIYLTFCLILFTFCTFWWVHFVLRLYVLCLYQHVLRHFGDGIYLRFVVVFNVLYRLVTVFRHKILRFVLTNIRFVKQIFTIRALITTFRKNYLN